MIDPELKEKLQALESGELIETARAAFERLDSLPMSQANAEAVARSQQAETDYPALVGLIDFMMEHYVEFSDNPQTGVDMSSGAMAVVSILSEAIDNADMERHLNE
jgi:hypothetical protein